MIWFAVRAMTSPSPNNSSHVNSFLVFMYLTNGMVGFGPAALAIMPVLRCPLCCTKPVPPRKVLGRIWAASRHTLVVMSVTFLAFFINNVSDPRHESDTSSDTKYSTTYAVSPMFPSVMILFCAAISKPTMRQRRMRQSAPRIQRSVATGSQRGGARRAHWGERGQEAPTRHSALCRSTPRARRPGQRAGRARAGDKVIPLVLVNVVHSSRTAGTTTRAQVRSERVGARCEAGDGQGRRRRRTTVGAHDLARPRVHRPSRHRARSPCFALQDARSYWWSAAVITRLWCDRALRSAWACRPRRALATSEEPSAQSEVPPLTSSNATRRLWADSRPSVQKTPTATTTATSSTCCRHRGGFGSFAAFNDCIRTIFVQGLVVRVSRESLLGL